MEGIMMVVSETVQSFNQEHNLGKDIGKDMLFYCRPTVENYIFSKLHEQLFAMYCHKNETDDELFMDRSLKIKQMKPNKVMDYLGINKKFFIKKSTFNMKRILSQEKKQDETFDSEGDTKSKGGVTERTSLPYVEAVREIEKI